MLDGGGKAVDCRRDSTPAVPPSFTEPENLTVDNTFFESQQGVIHPPSPLAPPVCPPRRVPHAFSQAIERH